MMTDQELLEYAAKAAELVNPRYVENTSWGTGISHGEGDQVYVVWNPLTSDEDAFRLMCDLGIDIESYYMMPHLCRGERVKAKGIFHHVEAVGLCPRTPVRRAIVRAAAELGKQMMAEEETLDSR